MLSAGRALAEILRRIRPLGVESVSLKYAAGRVLARDIYSRFKIPPFDNSAMDGYAVKAADLNGATKRNPKVLKVIGTIKAGTSSNKRLASGEVMKIMTGAPLLNGADSVVMVEYTKSVDRTLRGGPAFPFGEAAALLRASPFTVHRKNKYVAVYRNVRKGENIRRAGEDIKKGELILRKGAVIRPAEMGVLASMGKDKVSVHKKPKAAFFVTGDELAGVKDKLKAGKIRNTNSFTLYGQLLKYDAIPVDLGLIRDSMPAIKNVIRYASRYDMIVSSGGVSVGDYDYLQDAFKSLGGRVVFWKVSMKPGKPFLFGTIKGLPLFGVPGNPVSSMITFEQFVAPAILKMAGRNKVSKMSVRAKMTEAIYVSPKRRNYIRVHVASRNGVYYASSTGPQGSAILKSMSRANGILTVLEGVGKVNKGSMAEIELIDHMGL